jgi:hypothetical protein
MAKHDDLEHDENSIHQVITAYYDAFPRDPAMAATFYGEPAIFALGQGVFALTKRADVEAALASALSELKHRGYSYSKLDNPRIKMLSATTAIYGVVAVRCKVDGTELERAGLTYVLHRDNSNWRIYELIATDLDELVTAN